MVSTPFPPAGPQRTEVPAAVGASAFSTLAVAVVVIAALYFGGDLFVPLALAVLLSFALAPLVIWLRRHRVGRLPAVLGVVLLAFAAIFGLGTVIATQVTSLAESLPLYQRNIEEKINALHGTEAGGGVVERASEVLNDLRKEITEPKEERPGADGEAPATTATPDDLAPIPVEIRRPAPEPLELLQSVVAPLIEPLTTSGIVIVFVVLMLLQREDLRDRLIRLAGSRDLQRTTEALDEAAGRVSHYLLTQLVVNATYGIPVGVGLWLIGVPNPVLWGILAMLLRFVPYVGPIVAAAFPLVLSIAVDPGWTMLLWTATLFIVLELVSNNVVEPWLYGASTGLSPLAIIFAAIFWTWLWGPVGLLLSTPLTVCFVVLGRHVPQLAFLDVLLGNEPVLSPEESLYQRLLAGDPDEATERAEDILEESSLATFYDEVAVPALALAERDRARGVLDDERRALVAAGAAILIDNLSDHEDIAADEAEAAAETPESTPLPPGWRDRPVLCAGGRGNLDDAAAGMLAQLLERRGIGARVLSVEALAPEALPRLETEGVRAICLSYMNASSLAHARFLIRRLRRRLPDAPILVGLWTFAPDDGAHRDPLTATRADLVATSLDQAAGQIAALASQTEPAAAAATGGASG